MSRTRLLALELLVAVAAVLLWHVLTTVPIGGVKLLPPFFFSTPSDVVRLGSAMLKPGVLKAETIATFATPARLASGATSTYALGWTVSTVQLAGRPVRMVSHRGSPMGGTATLLTFPDLGLAVSVAANTSEATGVQAYALQVAEAFAQR